MQIYCKLGKELFCLYTWNFDIKLCEQMVLSKYWVLNKQLRNMKNIMIE